MTEQMSDNIVFSTLKKMFNNPDYSDIVFVVNNTEYQALRAFVAATTDVFEALLLKGFQEANQKKIDIPDVKNQESFYHILRYIYGLKIDFSTLSVELLCEMIEMAEYYHLPSLFTSIQSYLETMKTCYHKSVGVLVNVAKLYKLDALYTIWKSYIFKNASLLINSNDLTNISYDVLFDLMGSSETMNTTEITKLKFTLDWFNKNDEQTYSTNEKILLVVDKVDKNNLEKEKDKFISIIIKNINFDKITSAELIRLFKGHDEYNQYEKIVNDNVISNYNCDIEKLDTKNLQFSMKTMSTLFGEQKVHDFVINNFHSDIEELDKKVQCSKRQLSVLFGEPKYNFLLALDSNREWYYPFNFGAYSQISIRKGQHIIFTRSDNKPITGIVAIFKNIGGDSLDLKRFCLTECSERVWVIYPYIPPEYKEYGNLRVEIYV